MSARPASSQVVYDAKHAAQAKSKVADEVDASSGPSRGPSTIASLISGTVGGMTQVVVGQPLDTLRVRAQLAARGQYKNTWDIATTTVRREGFLALYKGMASPLVGIGAVNGLLFTAFGQAKKIISPYPSLSVSQVAVAGGVAGAVNSLLASPVEMFKIRMQGQYGGAGDKKLGAVVREMVSLFGLRNGVMRGFWVTVLREVPAYMGFYTAYELSKKALQRRLHGVSATSESPLPIWATLAAGSTGGVAYWTACYPIDVVKSRVQNTTTPLNGIGYISRTFRTIYAENGLGSFFRGLTPTYLRAVPAAAVTFVAFETTMSWLKANSSIY